MNKDTRQFSDGLKRLLRNSPEIDAERTRELAKSLLAQQRQIAELLGALAYPLERVLLELGAGSIQFFREGTDVDSGGAGKKKSYRFPGVKKEHAEEMAVKLADRKEERITTDEFTLWARDFLMRFTFEMIEEFSKRAFPPPRAGGAPSHKRCRWRLGEACDAVADLRSEIAAGNVRLVAAVVQRRKGKFPLMPLDDLWTHGYDGLKTAINRYDPAIGAFSTYAYKWIMQGMDRYAMRNRHIIRVPIGVQDKAARDERRDLEVGDFDRKKTGVPVIPIVESLDEPALGYDGKLLIRDTIEDESAIEPSKSVVNAENVRTLKERILKLDSFKRLVLGLRNDVGDPARDMAKFVKEQGAASRKRARELHEAAGKTGDEPARLRLVDTPSLAPRNKK